MRAPHPLCIAKRQADGLQHDDHLQYPCVCQAPHYEDLLDMATQQKTSIDAICKTESWKRYKAYRGKEIFLIQNPALIAYQMAKGATVIKRAAPKPLPESHASTTKW